MPDRQPRHRPGEPSPALVQPPRPRPSLPGGAEAPVPEGDDTPTDHSAAPLLGARFCRARSASSTTRVAAHRMRNSPASQPISNVDVFNVCTRWPVAGSVFSDIAVRLERWKAGVVAFMSTVLVPLEISDVWTVVLFPIFLKERRVKNESATFQ